MSTNEQWIENAERMALFVNENETGVETELLKISPTNRTVAGKKQAQILATLRFAASYYTSIYPERPKSYVWIGELADIIEQYQLTMDGEQNSRRQFMKVMIAKFMNIFRGARGVNNEMSEYKH